MTKQELREFLRDSGTVDCGTDERTREVCKMMADMFDCPIGCGYVGNFGRYTFPVYSGRAIEGNSSSRNQPVISYEEFIEAYMSDAGTGINAMDVL